MPPQTSPPSYPGMYQPPAGPPPMIPPSAAPYSTRQPSVPLALPGSPMHSLPSTYQPTVPGLSGVPPPQGFYDPTTHSRAADSAAFPTQEAPLVTSFQHKKLSSGWNDVCTANFFHSIQKRVLFRSSLSHMVDLFVLAPSNGTTSRER